MADTYSVVQCKSEWLLCANGAPVLSFDNELDALKVKDEVELYVEATAPRAVRPSSRQFDRRSPVGTGAKSMNDVIETVTSR